MGVTGRTVRNAAEVIKARQGGISTVYIADLKELLAASGAAPGEIDAAILAEARAGAATLARTSTTRLTERQKAGGLRAGDEYFHTVTFKAYRLV